MGKQNESNRIQSLPESERPRERLINKGAKSLSIVELFEIIISKGNSKRSVVNITHDILSEYSDLNELKNVAVKDLTKIKGIGIAKACQIVAMFELTTRLNLIEESLGTYIDYKAEDLFKLLNSYYSDKSKEHLIVISLDSRKRVSSIDVVSVGTINETIAHPREVFKTAIDNLASYIVIAHNHPSGDVQPSSEDLRLTRRLLDASYTIGIPIIDHLIVSEEGYMSMKDQNLLN